MPTHFHPISGPGAATTLAVVMMAFISPLPCSAFWFFTAKAPVVVTLSAGVGGEEIQQALDNLPAAGGEVVLPEGEFQSTSPLF